MTRRLILMFCLTFVATTLTAGENKSAKEFRWQDDADQGEATLMYGGQPVLKYMYAFETSTPQRLSETFKVYHHVYGPKSGERITKGPGGLFTHHRGLYVGWMRTKFDGQSLDFWHGKNGAHQRHVEFIEKEAGPTAGKMTSEILWQDGKNQPVVREVRSVTVAHTPEEAWQIDWTTTLHSERGEIELDGDRQHAGFQFRADQGVAEKNSARYIRPEGFPQQEAAFQVGDKGNPPPHINLGWLAMTYPLDGKQYTVAYFEDPALPKPSLFSERPYGRFGAFFKTKITKEQPLTMRYRVLVFEGETPTQAEFQERYDDFVDELKRRSN